MYNANFQQWVSTANGEKERMLRQAIHTIIVAIAHDRHLRDFSYLKGGILLALRYGSIRHTTDLDFSNSARYSERHHQAVIDTLVSALPATVEALGYDLDCRLQSQRVQPSPQHTYVNLEMRIGYAPKGTPAHRRLQRGQASDTISIDYNFFESVPDKECIGIGDDGTLYVYGLATLIAEKFRAMLQQPLRNRMRRQDVYDLNHLIEKFSPFNPDQSAQILTTLIAKCEERQITPTRDSMANGDIYRRAQAEYPHLAAEVEAPLPDFDGSFRRVRQCYEALPWPRQGGRCQTSQDDS